MIRRAILVAAAAAAVIFTPSVAMAYNAPNFTSSVSDSTPEIGQSTTVTVNGGVANANKVIKLVITKTGFTKTMTATANDSGVATFTFTLSAYGAYTVQALSTSGALLSEQTLTVSGEAAAAVPAKTPSTLSFTGFESAGLAAGGVVLVLAGAGAVVVAKRRKTAQVHA